MERGFWMRLEGGEEEEEDEKEGRRGGKFYTHQALIYVYIFWWFCFFYQHAFFINFLQYIDLLHSVLPNAVFTYDFIYCVILLYLSKWCCCQ